MLRVDIAAALGGASLYPCESEAELTKTNTASVTHYATSIVQQINLNEVKCGTLDFCEVGIPPATIKHIAESDLNGP